VLYIYALQGVSSLLHFPAVRSVAKGQKDGIWNLQLLLHHILSDFSGRKKETPSLLLPIPQHLSDGLPDHLVRGGLMDWYLDIGTVPVSGVRY
jgi:hypothetical protein